MEKKIERGEQSVVAFEGDIISVYGSKEKKMRDFFLAVRHI